MPPKDFNSPKAIANRIKSKGLSKLCFFCQMCNKQCRDANGFKCHTKTEGHMRMMSIFAENPDSFMTDFSRNFERGYLEVLSRRFGTRRVLANIVYNEYIQDKEHVHMNSTIWPTLSDFVKYLGRQGKATIEETDRGWFLTYLRGDEADRAAAAERKRSLIRGEEERRDADLALQIAQARALVAEEEGDDDEDNDGDDNGDEERKGEEGGEKRTFKAFTSSSSSSSSSSTTGQHTLVRVGGFEGGEKLRVSLKGSLSKRPGGLLGRAGGGMGLGGRFRNNNNEEDDDDGDDGDSGGAGGMSASSGRYADQRASSSTSGLEGGPTRESGGDGKSLEGPVNDDDEEEEEEEEDDDDDDNWRYRAGGDDNLGVEEAVEVGGEVREPISNESSASEIGGRGKFVLTSSARVLTAVTENAAGLETSGLLPSASSLSSASSSSFSSSSSSSTVSAHSLNPKRSRWSNSVDANSSSSEEIKAQPFESNAGQQHHKSFMASSSSSSSAAAAALSSSLSSLPSYATPSAAAFSGSGIQRGLAVTVAAAVYGGQERVTEGGGGAPPVKKSRFGPSEDVHAAPSSAATTSANSVASSYNGNHQPPTCGAAPVSAAAASKPPGEKIDEELEDDDIPWLRKGIVVKILNSKVGGGRYYNAKAAVVDVVEDGFVGVLQILSGAASGGGGGGGGGATEELLKVDQSQLETVIPSIGAPVLLLKGPHAGRTGLLESLDVDNFCATLSLAPSTAAAGMGKILELRGVEYEAFSKLWR